MSYVTRDELVGCEASLIGPGRTVSGVDLPAGTRGTIIALRGRHGSHRSLVVVRTEAGVEFAARRALLNVARVRFCPSCGERWQPQNPTTCGPCGAYVPNGPVTSGKTKA